MEVDDYARKAAEVAVLRQRLQQVERENVRLQNDLVQAKDHGVQNDQVKQLQGEVVKLQNELRYASQDLLSSEGERKRLQSNLATAQSELERSIKRRTDQQELPPPVAAVAAVPTSATENTAVASTPSACAPTVAAVEMPRPPLPPPAAKPMEVTQLPASGAPPLPSQQSVVPFAHSQPQLLKGPSMSGVHSMVAVASSATPQRDRLGLLPQALAKWQTASCLSSEAMAEGTLQWCSLSDMLLRWTSPAATPPNLASETALLVAQHLEKNVSEQAWTAAAEGARFVRIWGALMPEAIVSLASKGGGSTKWHAAGAPERPHQGSTLFEALSMGLHAAVLGPVAKVQDGTGQERCARAILEALLELAGKLRLAELEVFGSLFDRPSLCALLAAPTGNNSLHVLSLRLLQRLLHSPVLFARAHQAASHENALLAAANLLLVPPAPEQSAAIAGGEGDAALDDQVDTAELQECRHRALELFSCCLVSAPRPDMVLQLRCAATVDGIIVDTVLQRLVLLCHHELLALHLHGFDGGPWHSRNLQECAKRRLACAELSLGCMANFVWHALPALQPEDKGNSSFLAACASAATLLGRTGGLLLPIIDTVQVLSKEWPAQCQRLLSSTSALRVLLAHLHGESGGTGVNANAGGDTNADVMLL
mmetsp:Transcript_46812/g.85715  ORF Transcript_46812/g.85715 Transcript_46812/m.85715 type:complete len:653 (+) Transcript_46812:100-2058(+)